jgi:hypothetical protein
MKKNLSVLGILFMLMLKHPPMPNISIFQKIQIVEVRGFSMKMIALEFFMNSDQHPEMFKSFDIVFCLCQH